MNQTDREFQNFEKKKAAHQQQDPIEVFKHEINEYTMLEKLLVLEGPKRKNITFYLHLLRLDYNPTLPT